MIKNTKLFKLGAFLVALMMMIGSFSGGYNVTISRAEEAGEVTGPSPEEIAAAEAAAAAEEAARIAAEEEAARIAAEEEAARVAAEQAAAEEAARKAAEEEAARKAAEEEAARKAAEEAARKAAEEEAARKAAEEEAARQAEVSKQIDGQDDPGMSSGDDFDDFDDFDEDDFDEYDDFDDFDEFEDDEDDGTIFLDDWDAGVVSDEMLDRFNNSTANYEQMEFNGTAEIELENEGTLKYGDEIKLNAKVQDVNLSYRLIWEANDSDDRGWYTIASGENYSYTLTADNVAREYRVVLFSLD